MIVLLLTALLAGGPIEAAPLPPERRASYDADIAPIFAAKCAACHAGTLTEGGLSLATHELAMKGGKRGPAIRPGDAGGSFLWASSAHRAKPVMPPKSEDNDLTPTEVALLKRWIDAGAAGPSAPASVKPRPALRPPAPSVRPVRAVAVAPDGAWFAFGRGSRVFVAELNAKPPEPRELLAPDGAPHVAVIDALAVSPDGKRLASASHGTVAVWDAPAGKLLWRRGDFAGSVACLAFSPDGATLAGGGGVAADSGEVQLLDAATGETRAAWPGAHSDVVGGVAFHPGGAFLVSGGADRLVKVWSLADPAAKPRVLEGHSGHVLDVAVTPDGKTILSAGAEGVLKSWDFATGDKSKDVAAHAGQVTRLAVAPKAKLVLSAGGDKLAKAWRPGESAAARAFAGAADFLCGVATSADGAVVVAGGEDGTARVYDGATGKLRAALGP